MRLRGVWYLKNLNIGDWSLKNVNNMADSSEKFHFASICNVLPCELRLFWYLAGALNQAADCRQKIFVKGGKRQSANSQPTVGQHLADCWLGELFFIFSHIFTHIDAVAVHLTICRFCTKELNYLLCPGKTWLYLFFLAKMFRSG